MSIATSLADLEQAASLVHRVMAPTPQISWPLLNARAGREVWVKHENHTPVGAAQMRGGIVYLDCLKSVAPDTGGVIVASTGNLGLAIAHGAARLGLSATIVLPEAASEARCAWIRAHGAKIVQAGDDFQEAVEHAARLAGEEGLHLVPPFHPWMAMGAASAALELFHQAGELDDLFVPVGMGSLIAGAIAARDALGLKTRIVGVVGEGAPCYADSFWAEKVVNTNGALTMAEGLACRSPDPVAVALITQGAERVVTVSDGEIRAAMRHCLADTRNPAEAAGAAALAGLLADGGKGRAGAVLSGGNLPQAGFREILEEEAPS